jgi:hypothetical protein
MVGAFLFVPKPLGKQLSPAQEPVSLVGQFEPHTAFLTAPHGRSLLIELTRNA